MEVAGPLGTPLGLAQRHAVTEILKRLLYEESELSGTSIKQRFLWLELH